MRTAHDQASSLRESARARGCEGATAREHDVPPSPPRRLAASPLLAVASGKGGVGKTFLAINLALALRDQGLRCLLADLDWGLANIDVALGLAPSRHVGHVLAGECALSDAVVEHEGLAILPNGCGEMQLAHLARAARISLLDAVCAQVGYTLVIADTHPGIGVLTLDVLREAKLTLVVSTPEPTALTDTYALFKMLQRVPARGEVGLIMNQAASPAQALQAANHLDTVARRFLGCGIEYWGHLPHDAAVPRSVAEQRALLTGWPRSAPARAVRGIAERAASLIAPISR